jgi:hypothetical protein
MPVTADVTIRLQDRDATLQLIIDKFNGIKNNTSANL